MKAHFHTLHFVDELELTVYGHYETGSHSITIDSILSEGTPLTKEEYECIPSYHRLTLIESILQKLNHTR